MDELRQRMNKMEPELLPDDAREAIGSLFDQVEHLETQVDLVEERIIAWHKSNEASRRLAADSDDRAHVFRSDAAQRSDLIARR